MRHNNDFYFSLNLHLGLCVLDGPVWLQRIYISIMCQQQRRRWHATMKKKMQSLLRHIFDTFPYISIAAAVVILHIDQKESPELNCTHYSEKKKWGEEIKCETVETYGSVQCKYLCVEIRKEKRNKVLSSIFMFSLCTHGARRCCTQCIICNTEK